MGNCDPSNFHQGSVLYAGMPVNTFEGAYFHLFFVREFAVACLTGAH